jgi:non-heme chloroperoxidase
MRVCFLPVSILLTPLYSQPLNSGRDKSPHTTHFLNVDKNVLLEVLDWGGQGRPVILLAGGGNTAHVFDDLGPKLATEFHVYGITRRGFGASGFSEPLKEDEMDDDILAVIDSLKLSKPLLVGHSIAGAELSSVALSSPDRIAGLVYLDAGYPYAFDNGKGPTMKEFNNLRSPQRPNPGDDDLSSFRALQGWEARSFGFLMPEGEYRQTWDTTANGRPLKRRNFQGWSTLMTMLGSTRKYTEIQVPALVIFADPHVTETWMADPDVRKATEIYFTSLDSLTKSQVKALRQGVPTARVVSLRGAHHIFISNEVDVLREIYSFAAQLK